METHTKQRHTESESIDAVTVDCHSLLQVAGSSLAGNPRPQLPKHLCDTTSLLTLTSPSSFACSQLSSILGETSSVHTLSQPVARTRLEKQHS